VLYTIVRIFKLYLISCTLLETYTWYLIVHDAHFIELLDFADVGDVDDFRVAWCLFSLWDSQPLKSRHLLRRGRYVSKLSTVNLRNEVPLQDTRDVSQEIKCSIVRE
jgi:hypothetical protein